MERVYCLFVESNVTILLDKRSFKVLTVRNRALFLVYEDSKSRIFDLDDIKSGC